MRTTVVVFYAFAAFAKLNHDFLDPAASCATQFYRHVTTWLPLPTADWAVVATPWGTLIAEAALPIGLLFARGRGRLAVIALGIVFHLALSLDASKHFVNFSAVMMVALVVFLPRRDLAALTAGRVGRSTPLSFLGGALVVLFLLGIATAYGALLRLPFFAWRHLLMTAFAFFLLARLPWRTVTDEPRAMALGFAPMLVIALAVLNGLSPYLGLKTRTAFDMYSNLRLEADRSNHLLVPRSLDALGILADRVTILDVQDPEIRAKLASAEEWPWFEFMRALGESTTVRTTFIHDGEQVTYDAKRLGRYDEPPWILRKLLVFRPLGEKSRGLCLW